MTHLEASLVYIKITAERIYTEFVVEVIAMEKDNMDMRLIAVE